MEMKVREIVAACDGKLLCGNPDTDKIVRTLLYTNRFHYDMAGQELHSTQVGIAQDVDGNAE